jgi:disulfide oxidoreductase YuzD
MASMVEIFARAGINNVKLPVPHPTSMMRSPSSAPAKSKNNGARRLLHLPMYRSYPSAPFEMNVVDISRLEKAAHKYIREITGAYSPQLNSQPIGG